jgi:hypothetical protein
VVAAAAEIWGLEACQAALKAHKKAAAAHSKDVAAVQSRRVKH